ncbi:MAG: LysE family translocator [Gammaproteobacteria bacterium]|nr:LysE family translocator [Gammaproteobacteria bacterium]
MFDSVGLTTAAAAFFVVAASPGPATIAVAGVSMRSGRQTGLRFGFGLSVGLAFWGLVAATGLGAVLQASSHGLVVLKLLGGAYLLWLAARSALTAGGGTPAPAGSTAAGGGFRRGLLLNLSNPKAVLAWMATLALGVGPGVDTGCGIWQVAAATTLCSALGLLIYVAYALTFSTSGAMGVYQRLRRWIDGLTAGLFTVSGLGLIRSAFERQ